MEWTNPFAPRLADSSSSAVSIFIAGVGIGLREIVSGAILGGSPVWEVPTELVFSTSQAMVKCE